MKTYTIYLSDNETPITIPCNKKLTIVEILTIAKILSGGEELIGEDYELSIDTKEKPYVISDDNALSAFEIALPADTPITLRLTKKPKIEKKLVEQSELPTSGKKLLSSTSSLNPKSKEYIPGFLQSDSVETQTKQRVEAPYIWGMSIVDLNPVFSRMTVMPKKPRTVFYPHELELFDKYEKTIGFSTNPDVDRECILKAVEQFAINESDEQIIETAKKLFDLFKIILDPFAKKVKEAKLLGLKVPHQKVHSLPEEYKQRLMDNNRVILTPEIKKEISQPMPFRKEDRPNGTLHGKNTAHPTCNKDTKYTPGVTFVKQWEFINDGNVPWPQKLNLIYVSLETGDQMCDFDSFPIELKKRTRKGEKIIVSIPLRTPDQPKEYRGYWKLSYPVDGNNKKFGQRVVVKVDVVAQPDMNQTSPLEKELLLRLSELGYNESPEMNLLQIRTAILRGQNPNPVQILNDVENLLKSHGIFSYSKLSLEQRNLILNQLEQFENNDRPVGMGISNPIQSDIPVFNYPVPTEPIIRPAHQEFVTISPRKTKIQLVTHSTINGTDAIYPTGATFLKRWQFESQEEGEIKWPKQLSFIPHFVASKSAHKSLAEKRPYVVVLNDAQRRERCLEIKMPLKAPLEPDLYHGTWKILNKENGYYIGRAMAEFNVVRAPDLGKLTEQETALNKELLNIGYRNISMNILCIKQVMHRFYIENIEAETEQILNQVLASLEECGIERSLAMQTREEKSTPRSPNNHPTSRFFPPAARKLPSSEPHGEKPSI